MAVKLKVGLLLVRICCHWVLSSTFGDYDEAPHGCVCFENDIKKTCCMQFQCHLHVQEPACYIVNLDLIVCKIYCLTLCHILPSQSSNYLSFINIVHLV